VNGYVNNFFGDLLVVTEYGLRLDHMILLLGTVLIVIGFIVSISKRSRVIKFSELVESSYITGKPNIIHNGSLEHGKYLLGRLLDVAIEKQEDVYIVCGLYKSAFYDDYTEKLQKLLDGGNSAYLIGLDSRFEHTKCEFFMIAYNHAPDNVLIASNDRYRGFSHFIIVDTMYRLKIDNDEQKATASFHNPQMGNYLRRQFAMLKREILDQNVGQLVVNNAAQSAKSQAGTITQQGV
jgi:hypothetical protein